MPLYSRHSGDVSEKLYLSNLEEDYYQNYVRMLYTNSSFGEDIGRHYDSSDADVIPPSRDSQVSKAEKAKQCQKGYHRNPFKKNLRKPILVIFVENQCPTALTNQDIGKLKSVRVLKIESHGILQ